MIKNERQYRITRAEAERFARSLDELAREPVKEDKGAVLRKAEHESLASQLEELREQIAEYDALRAGQRKVVELSSLEELPRAFVQARIASGMSHKDLADRLGLKEQQIQRYEATDYASASVSRFAEVAKALGVLVREEVFFPADEHTVTNVLDRLESAGLDKSFVMDRLVPRRVRDRAQRKVTEAATNLVFHVADSANRVFGWKAAAVLGTGALLAPQIILGATRFKVPERANEARLSVYTVYAHYLALLILRATEGLPQHLIPDQPLELRDAIIQRYGRFDFATTLKFAWDCGIPVLPLADSGAFHGACWRIDGRNVIVLKQRTQSLARWLFDLLHELRHTSQHPDRPDFAVIEASETSPERKQSEDEQDAIQFAGDAVLEGRAEELAQMTAKAARMHVPKLKAIVPQIAQQERVDTASLANYMAFRLTMDNVNWWGAAMNLQPAGQHPWSVARDELLSRIGFERLSDPDRELLVQALSETEA